MHIISWNVKGLKAPTKRAMVLRHLKKLRPDIVLLQETHLKSTDFFRLQKFWVGQVYGASAQGGKAGVIILIHKDFPFKLLAETHDAEGRWAHILFEHGGEKWSLYNVYGPNGENVNFYRDMESRIQMDNTLHKIFGGDLNTVLCQKEDRKALRNTNPPPRSRDKVLAGFVDSTGLRDVWRLRHPDDREYTHFSHAHESWSRIDYIMVSSNLIGRTTDAEITDMVISDHTPVTLSVSEVTPKGTDIIWRFPARLFKDDAFKDLLNTWWAEYETDNKEHTNNPALFWATAKAVLRGRIRAYTSAINKKVSFQYESSSKTLRAAYTTYLNDPSPTHKQAWISAKQAYDIWLERREGLFRDRFESELLRFGNKAGKLLARLAKGKFTPSHIQTLRTPKGEITTDPGHINSLLGQYYRKLYRDEQNNQDDGSSFLERISLPHLTEDQNISLSADISEEELITAIKSLKNGKSPGPDGFIGEFYKSLLQTLTPILLAHFNRILHTGQIPSESNVAYIKLLPKPGKDPSEPSSYRPISLIDVDLKLLSKILANRLAFFLPGMIGKSQVGFVRGRAAVTNIRKVLTVLDDTRRHTRQVGHPILLSLDAEKAFDNVKWSWLNKVLDKMNICGNIRTFIAGLQANPTARIHTQGFLSESFHLAKGTRQGCPLSPLLFNIAIEPLARFLEDSDLYQGVKVGEKEVKMALFADDVILFMGDPQKHLQKVLQEIERYGNFSGYRINVAKSEILELDVPNPLTFWKKLQGTLPVPRSHITYLGIKIGKTSESLYRLNYPPLFDRITTELNKWQHLPLTFLGRCHLVKMISFPRLLYPLQTIPLLLRHKDVNNINKAFSKFIWTGRRARIALQKLMLRKSEGGLNFPNVRGYNLACLFRHVIDWIHTSSQSSCTYLERELALPWDLRALLHTRYSRMPKPIKTSNVLRDTIATWKEVRKRFGLPFLLSKHMSLWGHPEFEAGMNSKLMKEWRERGPDTPLGLINEESRKWATFPEIAGRFGLPNRHCFQYLQIMSFLRSRLCEPGLEAVTNQFDNILGSPGTRQSISSVYDRLREKLVSYHPSALFKQWERILGFPDTSERILKGWGVVKKHIISERWRETHFKLMHRALYGFNLPISTNCPDRLVACPKCNLQKADLWHGLWDCPAIVTFWRAIINYINTLWSFSLPEEPIILLFHSISAHDLEVMAIQKIPPLVHVILLVAKRCILRHWLHSTPPDIPELISQLKTLLRLEHIEVERHKENQAKKFFDIWKPFISKHWSREEISQMMLLYRHTEWYATEDLKDTLGALRISSGAAFSNHMPAV